MIRIVILFIFVLGLMSDLSAQIVLNGTVVTPQGETGSFRAQIPASYNPSRPPAIFVWWHGLGGNQSEADSYSALCNQRGWILACHMGSNDRHWNTARAQAHCQAMLDSLFRSYPFSKDSIYMAGGSMGGAAGQVWHNNNCGVSDYLIAATAGGSQILDCDLRQTQYLDSGHVNNSMNAAFGGYPRDNDSVAFQYHRASAIYFSDTSKSMHFNSLHLPVYNVWGTSEGTWSAEWFAYGHPAEKWDSLRRAEHADSTFIACSGINTHGMGTMIPDSILRWLSGFSANRFPDKISISADESDEYYWTRVTLADTGYIFGRYNIERNFSERRLDMTLIRNISGMNVEFLFPWSVFDTIKGYWANLDSERVATVEVKFTGLPAVTSVKRNGVRMIFTQSHDTLVTTLQHSGEYTISFLIDATDSRPELVPGKLRLTSAYPNPFNSQINFEIESPRAGVVELLCYDVLGRLADTQVVPVQIGTQRVVFDAGHLSSGIYFVRLNHAAASPVKITLIK